MKMSKKWSRFWKIQKHRAEGFTLVELIVVIAILAILAGVAVPAYSGYIEKANRAADEQLLAAVNTAFAAACAFHGEDHVGRTDVAAINLADGKIPADYVFANAAIDASVDAFFDGGQFKVITALSYNSGKGVFEEGVTVNYGNQTITVSKADVEKLLGTTWISDADMSSEDIVNMVMSTANAAQNIYGDIFNAMKDSEEFKNVVTSALGVDDYDAYYDDLVDKKAAELRDAGYSRKEASEMAEKEVNSNLAILVAAKNAQNVDIMSTLTQNGGAGAKDQIKGELETGNSAEGLSQAALAYGLYHAYIYSRDDLTDEQKAQETQVGAALNNLDSAGFQNYLTNNPQSQTDLNGLMAAMGVIGGQDKETSSSVVSNGFDNQDMLDALQSILGK